MHFINYQLLLIVVTCNLNIINYKFDFFVTCSLRKYFTINYKKNVGFESRRKEDQGCTKYANSGSRRI